MMIRILNFVSFALAALCCLALYHLSEETRVARVRLLSVEKQIVEDHDAMKVLQADWERVAEPSRIHALAQARLGLSDTDAIALVSLDLLPRHGEAPPLAGSPVQTASVAASVALSDPHIRLAAAHAGN